MTTDQILLIDISSLAYPIWAMSVNEPDPNHTSQQIVARVRALASQHPHAAICCDSGRSFRHDIDPTYKGQRPEKEAVLMHQIQLAEDALRKEGYPVWKVKGAEADDIIATAVKKTLAIDGTSVLIATADKDLLQLVGPRVLAKNTAPGGSSDIRGESDVLKKFGIKPSQMIDWLSLVGDASDNVKGADGIGPVKATALLREFGTLEAAYAAMAKGVVPSIKPAMRASLTAFKERWPVVRSLIALKSDVDIPFEEIATERTVPALDYEPSWEATPMGTDDTGPEPNDAGEEEHRRFNEAMHAASEPSVAAMPSPSSDGEAAMQKQFVGGATGGDKSSVIARINNGERGPAIIKDVKQLIEAEERAKAQYDMPPILPRVPVELATQPAPTHLARLEPAPAPAVPVEFERQLEPRSMVEAKQLAQMMFDSRMFSAFGTPQAVLAVVLSGRELNMPAMASLRSFHVIEGRPSPSADLLAALVMRSGKAKFFRCSERTPTRATFVTQRFPVEDYPPQTLSFTIEEARAAWKKDQKAWDASGWGKTPTAMLVARAKSALARLEYPDVVGNLYSMEEPSLIGDEL